MKHSSGRVPASPPVGFPLFGLDESWQGARWLDGFGDPVGDPPRWASLGHQTPAGDSRIVVTTHSRLATGTPRSFRIPTDAQAAEIGQSPLQYLAADAALQLTGLTLPVLSLARPPGFLRALVEYAEKAGSEYAQWPRESWRVDGGAVTARVWGFAGGWAAFTDAVEGAYLTAVGVGASPEGLLLAVLRDGSAYHFELDQPLPVGALSASAQVAAAQFEAPPWQHQEWHADQLRLMREPEQNSAKRASLRVSDWIACPNLPDESWVHVS